MYANVDQNGNLGSNFDAVGVTLIHTANGDPFYSVQFSKPIGSCAAVAQSGYAGGDLTAAPDPSEVIWEPKEVHDTFDVFFFTPNGHTEASAFMLTVTCAS